MDGWMDGRGSERLRRHEVILVDSIHFISMETLSFGDGKDKFQDYPKEYMTSGNIEVKGGILYV